MNKQFLKEVLHLCSTYCGDKYTEEINTIRQERERILNNYWREEPFPASSQKDEIYRDIDFDTALHYTHKYLDDRHFAKLAYSLADLAVTYGEFNQGLALLQAITCTYHQATDPETLALAHYKIGNINFLRNEHAEAESQFLKCLAIMEQEHNPKIVAMLNNARGILKVNANYIDDGIKFFEEAIKAATKIGADEICGNAHMNLGNTYHLRGEWDGAMRHYQEALQIFEKAHQHDQLAFINLNLTIAYKCLNDLNKAEECLRKAMELSRETNNKYQKGLGYLLEAELHLLHNETAAAIGFVTSAFAIFTEIGDRLSVAESYKILGIINRINKEYLVAQSFFENSRRINEEIRNLSNLAEVLIEIGKLYEVTDEKARAVTVYREAIDCLQKIGAQARISRVTALMENLA